MGELEELKQNRKELLKAEIAAWLHDMGKCTQEFFKNKKERKGYKAIFSENELGQRWFWSKLPEKHRRLPDREKLSKEARSPKALHGIIGSHLDILDFEISFPALSNQKVSCRDLIFLSRPGFIPLNKLPEFVRYLGRSHAAAHLEKEEPEEKQWSQFISTPFGWEKEKVEGDRLTEKLEKAIQFVSDFLATSLSREKLKDHITKNFSQALGDDRYPDNEVTLWDWGFVVSAFYKAALAGALLGYKPEPNELHWRLLSVRFDGLGFLSEAHRIPDLLGRKQALERALDKIRELLEVKYPLGTEVYRDENGSLFVVPGCKKGSCALDLLKLTDSNGKSLGQLIEGNVLDVLDGEIVPEIQVDPEPWWGQDPRWGEKARKGILNFSDEYPPVADHLKPVRSGADPERLQRQWADLQPKSEVCTVCGLRPQRFLFRIEARFAEELKKVSPSEDLREQFRRRGGSQCRLSENAKIEKKADGEWRITDGHKVYVVKLVNKNGEIYLSVNPQTLNQKLRERRICKVCDERRDHRVENWLNDLEENLLTTIWINEVADHNARVALIVGRFDLTHWLDGTLVRTLRVTDPASSTPPKYVPQKIPSFVRLYRIWSVIQRFWEEVAPVPVKIDEDGDKAREQYMDQLKRSIVGSVLEPVGPRLAIYGSLKDGAKDHPIRFHTYELVLERGIALSVVWDGERFLTCDNLDYLESKRQLGRPAEETLPSGTMVRVEQPIGYGAQNKYIGNFVVRNVEKVKNSDYVPVIPLLAEPQTFMALVPADRALEIVKEIKQKYEREMGKVRNRLPLHLGLVFAHRRTPLRAILDAGRRLLQTQGLPVSGWRVEKKEEVQNAFEGDPHFAKALRLRLKLGDREATWQVPLMMGDGDINNPDRGTKDVWYPYVFRHGPEPLEVKRRFLSQNPYRRDENGDPMEGWLVHVEDLKEDDTIYFTPATLDWVWLDTNARRFEIDYDEQGQRRSPHLKRRPYLLDELEVLERIWETLEAHLSRNQIHILRETIEAKRAQWGYPSPYDETFQKFCHDLLAEAEWRKGSFEATVPENRRGKLPWEVEGLEKDKWLERWANYAARGWLADAVELYWEILKGGREEEPVREVERT